jgi:hypothetical protein
MKLSEHAVVAAELTADNRAEIASWQPRDQTLRLWYSWSRVEGGFAAVVKVPDPVQGVRVLAETSGRATPMEAARAVYRTLHTIRGPHPLDRFLVGEPIGRLSQGEPEPVE